MNTNNAKSQTRQNAEAKGHIMTLYSTDPTDGATSTADCVKCRMSVTVTKYPVLKAYGPALENNCGGEK